MKGLETYTTQDSFKVIKLHYTADKEKSTSEWLKETEKGYSGGRGSAA